jgi:hypothetical protein
MVEEAAEPAAGEPRDLIAQLREGPFAPRARGGGDDP